MSIKNALEFMVNLHNRVVTFKRLGTPDITFQVKASPSNYFRNLAGPSDVVMEGREFVIPKSEFIKNAFTSPIKRGDRLVDTELGTMIIAESREMYDIGGDIIGFRVRTEE